MIRENHLFCNLIRIKSSTKSLFKVFMSSFKPVKERCPICKRTGDCTPFASYERYAVDIVSGKPFVSTLKITRVVCSCGCTHAILPDPIIPYASYSLLFILRALAEYALNLRTVSELCDRFGIVQSTLYRWKRIFEKHRREWLGLLSSLEQTILSSIKKLIVLKPYKDFAMSFFKKTGLSFLQSHRNPSHSPRGSPTQAPV